jgi:hypothetical protein
MRLRITLKRNTLRQADILSPFYPVTARINRLAEKLANVILT